MEYIKVDTLEELVEEFPKGTIIVDVDGFPGELSSPESFRVWMNAFGSDAPYVLTQLSFPVMVVYVPGKS